MPVRTVKTNLWPFGSAKTPRPSARKSSMTVAAAMSAAYKAGKASGDTGLFDSWLESKGLEDRSDTLKNRLRKEYERGHETNYGTGGASTEAHEERLAAKGLKYKGYTIREVEGGYSTSLDRESVHDSVKDAKDFIDDHKRNPNKALAKTFFLQKDMGGNYRIFISRHGEPHQYFETANAGFTDAPKQFWIKKGYREIDAPSRENPAGDPGRKISVYGIDRDGRGNLSRLTIEARRADGSIIDIFREETASLSVDDLWKKFGPRQVQYFKRVYGISEVELPSQFRQRHKRNPESDSDSAFESFHGDHKRNPAGHSLQSAKAWAASQGTKLGREHHYGDAPLSESTAETWVSLTSFFDAPKQQRAYARLFKSAYDKAARKHHGNPPDTQEFRNALAALRRAVNEQGGTIRGQDGGTWGVSFQVEPPDGRGMIGYLVSPEGKITRSWITSPEEYDRMKRRKRNPESSADSAFESFHGEPPKETVIIEEQIHEHEHLWNCGTLIEMVIDTLTGKEVTFSFDGDAPYLSCSEDGAQLYIEGGDQTIDLKAIGMDGKRWVKDRMVIGTFAEPRGSRKWNITYRTKKDFDKFEEIDYQHWLGEPSKELRNPSAPLLEYDPRSQKLYISGGQYIIKKPIFGTSPGIEN